MAYYMITYNEKLYANVDLYQSFYRMPSAAFMNALAQGRVNAVSVLGNVLTEITKATAARMLEQYASVTVQDLDRALDELVPASGGAALKASTVLKLNDVPFIRFNEAEIERKYAKRDKFATIRVCGSLYIALGRKKKGQDSIVLSARTEEA